MNRLKFLKCGWLYIMTNSLFAIWDLHAKITVPVLINYYYCGIKFLINFYKQKNIVLDTVFGINRS